MKKSSITQNTNVIVDKKLNKYDNKPIFQKKLTKVNKLLEGVELPEIAKPQ
jgi:ribose 5-phosphate isomerase